MSIKKIISGLIILSFLLFLFFVKKAEALAPTGTLVGTAISVNIGQIKAINTLTITDTTPEITNANDICIRIKAGTNADWDVSDTTPTFGGTGSGYVAAAVSYPTAKTLKIDVTTNFALNDTLTIADLSYIGHTATSVATVLEWAIDNTDCTAATYGDANANTAITVADGTEDTLTGVGATPTNPAAGVTTNYTIDFTVPANGVIPKNGKVIVDFPDDFDVSGVDFDSAAGIDGTFAVGTAAGAVVTLTRQNDGANSLGGAKQVILSTVVSSTTAATDKTLDVTTKTNGDSLLASATSANFTVDPEPITDLFCYPAWASGAIWLTWTVPDLTSTGYIVKYSLADITNDAQFGAATTFSQSWAGGTATNTKQELVTGLNPNETYYFNVKVTAEGSAVSLISNTGINCVAPTQAGSYNPPGEAPPEEEPVPEQVSNQGTITASTGGTVQLENPTGGSATVEVPQDSVSADTVFTVETVLSSEVAPAPAGLFMVGNQIYQITAESAGQSITEFDNNITVTFEYTDGQIEGAQEQTLQIYYYDSATSSWVALETVLDAENNTASALISHLTTFALIGQEEPEEEEEVEEKPISEMTVEELKQKIAEIQKMIVELIQKLISLLVDRLSQIQ